MKFNYFILLICIFRPDDEYLTTEYLSSFCKRLIFQPKSFRDVDLVIMRHIDELHLEHPFIGTRMLRDQLNLAGHEVGRRHLGTLMKYSGPQKLDRHNV